MRRLVLEATTEEFSKHDDSGLLEKIKMYEIIHLLRFDREEFAAILKIETIDSSIKIEDLMSKVDLKNAKVQLLEQDKSGAKTFFMSGKVQENSDERSILSFGGYLSTPFEIRDGKIKIAFLGDEKQLKGLLENLGKLDLKFRVASLTDAKFSPESPLNLLTEKQREVIVSAFEHGYYESPRRISSQELAKKLKLKSSTLVEHRRKAEQRLLSNILKES